MNKDDLIKALVAYDPVTLREVFSLLAKGFAEKAEALYDQNPEENGTLAQPYADIADLCDEAAMVFDPAATGPVDSIEEKPQGQPVTVTAAVTKRPSSNPWGSR